MTAIASTARQARRHRRARPLAGTFVAGAGAMAAVVGHQCAHVLGDDGAFATPFDAYAHVGLVPLAFVAGVLTLIALGFALAIRDSREMLAAWPRDVAREIARRGLLRALAAIVAIELVSLYGMEVGEQTLAFGHPLAGFAWLGGPVVSMVPLYLGVALATASLLVGLARVLAVACRAAAVLLTSYTRRFRPRLAAGHLRCRASLRLRILSAIARPGAKRGPPAAEPTPTPLR